MRLNSIVFTVIAGWLFSVNVSLAGLPDTVERVKRSIVGIGTYQATRQQPLQLLGTGFVITDGRHVATNYHVLSRVIDSAKGEFYVVIIGRGESGKWYRLKKVAIDPNHDLAIVHFNGPELPALNISHDKTVREGESYVFTGYPIAPVLGLYPVTHHAIIAALTPMVAPVGRSNALTAQQIRQMRHGAYNVYQLDATAYPGNSGSPLYHPETGEVIAILNSVYVKQNRENLLQAPSGISYAIPAFYVKNLMNRLNNKLSE